MRYINTTVIATAAVLLAGVLAQPARAQVSFDLTYGCVPKFVEMSLARSSR